MQVQVSRPALPPQEAVIPATVANRGIPSRDPTNEQCRYCTMVGHFVRTYPRLNHDIIRQRWSRSLKGEILGPQGEHVNWNSPGGIKRVILLLNNLDIAVVEAEPVAELVWDQPRGRGPQVNFILEGNGQDRVNITTRQAGEEKKLIGDTVMEKAAGARADLEEAEAGEQEKVYGKMREEEPVDKATATKKKFRYQIPILTLPELDDTLSKLLGTMVSISFQTVLQASPRLLKGLRQLLTRKRVEVEEAPEPQEQGPEEAEAPQGVSNLQSIPGGLEDLEKAFADIRLNMSDREGGEVMRVPPDTKLSFHALPVGKLKVQLDVIQAMHDGLAGGHRSSKGTLAKIVPLYFWPGMTGMVATYCQTCLICQERSSARVYEPLRPTRVLGPGHLVHLDLAVMPVSTDGFRYILDARDNLSGYVEAVALKRKTGKAVADRVEDFYLRHPFVRRFIADNGTEFVNQEVLNRLKILCVPIKITEPYHPEANALVERGHRTLKNTIAKLAVDDLGNSPRYLRQAVFSENVTPKRTTGCIPVELWYGREIDFPVEALVPPWNRLDDDPHLTTEELITARCQQVAKNDEALDEVVNCVMDSRMRDKARPTGEQPSRQAGESSSRKRKLYVGFDHNLVVNRGGRKQGIGEPLPLREGEPIVLPSESDTSSEEERNPGKRQRSEEKEPIEVIDLSSEEEEDEVTTPTREERGREEDSRKEKDKWIAEFGPTFSDWFDQWAAILRYEWAMKGKEKLSRGEDISPTTFFSEGTLLQLQAIKRQMQQEMEDRARGEARRRATGQ
ncbi:hypothetical protein CBR_g49320 [Chara braunii]|uniref:Integrase catalytic domain-containing protein n=1 Tax=Chara braunii TaxID=69332 RepID=A0A388M4N4_CHABU|nr:hypothetical protein CBR_g49320 [Chara braunii]|eukprot:GBG89530.1 hypothetical protein CBR_g49320 [Chara braunii]